MRKRYLQYIYLIRLYRIHKDILEINEKKNVQCNENASTSVPHQDGITGKDLLSCFKQLEIYETTRIEVLNYMKQLNS